MSPLKFAKLALANRYHFRHASCLSILTLLVGITPVSASAAQFCAPASKSIEPVAEKNKPTASADEIVVTSNRAELVKDQTTQFTGNVVIYQQQATVEADHASYDELTTQFLATGNIKLAAESASVKGESIFIDNQNKDFKLTNAKYQFGFNSGRGSADEFAIEKNQSLKLHGATFTTCPETDPTWLFSSKDIFINQDKGWGEAWNSVFKINDVPIIYLPYITFPVTDARKSGLLFPKFGNSSRYGTYYSQPIYYNWAENADITITPKYMSDRGLAWHGNLRYLTAGSYNELQLEYLNQDKNSKELGERYLAYWQHDSNWSDNWNIQAQWTDLSDDNYISEFNSNFHHQADTNLNNFVMVNYFSEYYDVSLLSQNMYELGPQVSSYKVPIQLDFAGRLLPRNDLFNLNINSQYSQFRHRQLNEQKVERLHLAPELGIGIKTPALQLESTISYLSTHYKKHFANELEPETLSRNIAKFRLLSSLTFEKQGEYFGKPVRQTLEPKIQYLYVETSEQSQIGLYDSQQLKEDYFALFRDNDYSGIDRISAMNQATFGFSTSIFDQKNVELLRFGIGQVHKFKDNLDVQGTNAENLTSKPALAVEWFGRLSESWHIDGGVLYNRETSEVDTGFVALDYWIAEDTNLQINHRYARDIADITINQTGLFASYNINTNWSLATSYHYDSERNISLDGLIGFEYRSCCWSVQVSAQRQVILDLNNQEFTDDSLVQYDNSIGINFKLNGLGGDASSAIANLFSDSMFAYRRPYLITN